MSLIAYCALTKAQTLWHESHLVTIRLIMYGAAAFAEAEAICTQPCTAVASAVAQVPAVYECAAGNADAATAAARAQAPALAPGPLVTETIHGLMPLAKSPVGGVVSMLQVILLRSPTT